MFSAAALDIHGSASAVKSACRRAGAEQPERFHAEASPPEFARAWSAQLARTLPCERPAAGRECATSAWRQEPSHHHRFLQPWAKTERPAMKRILIMTLCMIVGMLMGMIMLGIMMMATLVIVRMIQTATDSHSENHD